MRILLLAAVLAAPSAFALPIFESSGYQSSSSSSSSSSWSSSSSYQWGSQSGYQWQSSTPVTSVPEPGTLALMGAGLLAAGAMRKRRR